MSMVEMIHKKRDGSALSQTEIQHFIAGYMVGEIPDYQVSALLMAIYFSGMNREETVTLTEALVASGETLDLSMLAGIVADKHSTGGVGDKISLVLLPLVAAAGVTIAKMSGRGLGHTGGTIDKLSCIPGFRTDLTRTEFLAQVRDVGIAITGQTPQMTPADGLLYALRDVTATVDSIPLIASSIMSKKIASGAQNIVLDVKVGSGAFMRDLASARELAQMMTSIGAALGRKTVALLSAMEQPLGFAIGNHVEVIEAIETLQGYGPADVKALSLALGAELLVNSKLAPSLAQAEEILSALLNDGSALAMFRRFVAAQGGDTTAVDTPAKLGTPRNRGELRAVAGGFLCELDALKVGQAAVLLGAGREQKGAEIDLLAGIILHKKIGDFVAAGELLAEIFCNSDEKLALATTQLSSAYGYSEQQPPTSPLILERIEAENI
ncbi:MAG: thymidine phosphorylase [Firmicutes bacterium]|nr:thymidine phosphorylase [Bacillota bacterium]